ncbi:MAG: DUF1993 domain-containing protein [Pseudomonadota bacterium]
MSITDLLLPHYRHMLTALSGWLAKAGEGAETETLLSARLAPDMFPLSAQIRFCCMQGYEGVARLRGDDLPEIWYRLAEESRHAGDDPGTMAAAKQRLDEVLSFLAAVGPGALDAGAERTIAIDLPNGMIFDMTGFQYVRDWAVPQFDFHVVTAYAILRGQGVALGKADYVQHAFAYLRPGTMPQG